MFLSLKMEKMVKNTPYIVIMLLCNIALFAQSSLVINEIMPSNTTVVADEAGDFDDWIELRNNSTEWISLKNYHLTDTIDIIDKWKFPDDQYIAPHGYLIIWADENGNQGDLHANFKLDSDGEEIYLVDKTGVVIDQFIFGNIETDLSYSRIPNGTGDFQITTATFSFNNDDTSNTNEVNKLDYSFSPNPVTNTIRLTSKANNRQTIFIYDVNGRLLLKEPIENEISTIDVSHFNNGIYHININGLGIGTFTKI